MFDLLEGTIDHALERRREARRCAVRANREQVARLDHELTEIVRTAEAEGDWQAAGCSSGTQWLAQVCKSSYRTAEQITTASGALGALPATSEALSTGALNLEQANAIARHATPETEAKLAGMVDKTPNEIALEARKINPPTLADDQELYKRRALSMTWKDGGRELVINGRLPLEQGAVFEQAIWDIAKQQRALAKKESGEILDWQQSAADALVTLAQSGGTSSGDGVRRSPTTLIVHISDDGTPPMLEGTGPISPETAARLTCDARRLTIKLHGDDLVHSRVSRCASYPQLRAMHKRSGGHCQYPGCTATRELEGHHLVHDARGGAALLENMILECPRHHKRLHDYGIGTSGTGEHPIFTDANGRLITATQPHAPPA